jgi:hypothetical protein
MKKIKLTESQVSKLLNEDSSPSLKTVKNIFWHSKNSLKSGNGTLDRDTIRGIANELYDAMKGGGTELDEIKGALDKCKNMHDFANVRFKFYKMYNDTLLNWLDGDIDRDYEWTKYVMRPLQRIYDVSKSEGHFNPPKKVATSDLEKEIMKTFGCLKDTPGYEFQKDSSTGKGIFFKSTEGEFFLFKDGTLAKKKENSTKFDYFKNKTECTDVKYMSDINPRDGEVTETDTLMEKEKRGLNLNPDGVVGSKTEPEVKSTGTTVNTNTTGNTKTKSTVATAATGGSVSDFQQKLKDAGFGASLGSVDGKLGPKTARAAMEFIKSKGLLSETDDLSLNEQISQNFKRFL